MAIYGLAIFLETPKHLRAGRKRYIFISLFIAIATCLQASLDLVWIFEQLFNATSPVNLLEIVGEHYRTWGRMITIAVLTAGVSIGDFLLVSGSDIDSERRKS